MALHLIACLLLTSPSLDDRIQTQISSTKAVGASIAVLVRGKVVYSKGFGWQDREANLKASPSTRYRLASISKPVASVIANRMADAGKIDLTLPIRTYVPSWPENRINLSADQILRHVSGIRHYKTGRPDNGFRHYDSATKAVELFSSEPLLQAPGVKYVYSTHAFTLLAAALESASKKSYPTLVRELGQGTLQCEIAMQPTKYRAALYDENQKRYERREDLSWKYGGGGLESTATDLARFGWNVLNAKLVRGSTRDRMWTETTLPDGKKTGYGLGWSVGADTVGHSGSQQGASSCLLIDPKNQLVVTVLINTDGQDATAVARSVRESLLPLR
jgi:CubicO group peptidase (beta-lactamase class C family)